MGHSLSLGCKSDFLKGKNHEKAIENIYIFRDNWMESDYRGLAETVAKVV